MSAAAAHQIVPQPAGEDCAACDTPMVLTPDAIGRLRKRCPRCDGVSRTRVRHPDDLMLPQALVRVEQLPMVEPGQLRCQRCARGVEGRKRFCASCVRIPMSRGGRPRTSPPRAHGTNKARIYPPKSCRRCAAPFQPTGPNARYCEACR